MVLPPAQEVLLSYQYVLDQVPVPSNWHVLRVTVSCNNKLAGGVTGQHVIARS